MSAARAADVISRVPYGTPAIVRARALGRGPELEGFWDVVGTIVDPVGAALHAATGGKLDFVTPFGIVVHVPDELAAAGKLLESALSDLGDDVVAAVSAIEKAGGAVLAVVKKATPFIQLGLSFIPGIGTAASAALGAAVALCEGRGITDALLEGAKGACPGGPYVATAFEHAVAIVGDLAEGQSLADAASREAIDAARDEAVNAGGDAAGIAFDTALALAQGKRIQDAGLSAVEAVAKGYLPDTPEARAALQITHGALRGADTVATLEGAARDLIPLAPDGTKKAFETADDVYLAADELSRGGFGVVHDVHAKILGHAGNLNARINAGRNIARGARQAVEFEADANFSFGTDTTSGSASDAIAQSAPPQTSTSASRTISAFATNPLSIAAPRKAIRRYAPVSSGAPQPAAQDAGAQVQLSPRTRAARDSGQSPSEGMSTTAKVAIGVGAAAGLGLVLWLVLK